MLRCPRPRPRGFYLLAQSALAALGLCSEEKLAPRRATFISQNQYKNLIKIDCCAKGGAHLADERVGAKRRRKSEAQPNGEGVASGGATVI